MDTGQATGNTWNTVSYETEEGISISSIPIEIKRRPKDISILKVNISKSDKDSFAEGDIFNFNLSLTQWVGEHDRSYSNAYDVEIFMYYNSQFLTLQSAKNFAKDEFSMSPTFNISKPGLFHMKTDTFWLLNNQHILFELKIKIPSPLFKGDKCNDYIIVEYKYKTNLKSLGGTINYTIGELVPYKCKIVPNSVPIQSSIRLTVPEFSMLYDDVNGNFVFCKKMSSVSLQSSARCYLQKDGTFSWIGLPGIAATVGTDTAKNTLFGIDYKGIVYLKSHNGFSTFMQVEDTEWTSVESQPQIRKAKTATLVSLLPQSASDPWVISKSGNPLWAATKYGLMKMVEGSWKMVARWQ